MIQATLDDDDQYPDEFICEILEEQPLGCPGISNYAGPQYCSFVWCDHDRTPRGVLFIDSEAALRRIVAGNEFTVLVHPDWRRRGIATELYRQAHEYSAFELTKNLLYTTVGAKWASAMLDKSLCPREETCAAPLK